MSLQPTYASFLGIALEPAFGVAVAPVDFLQVKSADGTDKLTLIEDQGWRGSPVKTYGHQPGPLMTEYSLGGDVCADTIGYPIVGVMGDDAVTGTAAPYTHAVSLLNSGTFQPPTYTLTDNVGNLETLQYPGARFTSFSLKFSAGSALSWDAKVSALPSSVLGSTPTFSADPVPIIAGWRGAVTIGGTATAKVMDGEIDVERAIEVVQPVNGQQAPAALFAGELTASGKLTVVMESDTYRQQYIAGTSTSLDVNYQLGTGSGVTQINPHMSAVVLTEAGISRGKSYVELSLSFTTDGNTTDAGASGGYSPIKWNLQNAKPSGTYK